MSTRANIVLKESYSYKDTNGKLKNQTEKLIFYRHSDGYPEGTLPTLNKFCEWIKMKKIRNNLSQSAGWLVLLGAMEYNTIPKFKMKEGSRYGNIDSVDMPTDDGSTWKAGAYEPTTSIHGDIEYLYEINVVDGSLTYKKV